MMFNFFFINKSILIYYFSFIEFGKAKKIEKFNIVLGLGSVCFSFVVGGIKFFWRLV